MAAYNPSGSCEAIIKAVADMWYRGCDPSDELMSTIPSDMREALSYILNDVKDVISFSSHLTHGTLTSELHSRGRVASELKDLHADLRHLAWQARKIAEGNLEQNISFMGEFSEAFNRIVGELSVNQAKQTKELAEARMATIFAMAKLSEFRDEDTGHHLERTRSFCEILAQGLSKDPRFYRVIDETFIEALRNASPLHDIGKVAIPDAILLKQGPLNDEEQIIMRRHPELGAKTLMAVRGNYPNNSFIDMGIAISRSHHERWDGRGYPDGMSGLEIPLPARIMAVSDVYDALRAKRCYKAPMSHEDSVKIILGGADIQFDPGIVEVFMQSSDEFDRVWTNLQE